MTIINLYMTKTSFSPMKYSATQLTSIDTKETIKKSYRTEHRPVWIKIKFKSSLDNLLRFLIHHLSRVFLMFPNDCKQHLLNLTPQQYLEMVPPDNMRIVVGPACSEEDYIRVGLGIRNGLVGYGLKNNHSVLDMGCGCGRVASALTDFLLPTARYDGFDIVPRTIQWCQDKISNKYPNFNFHCAHLFNNAYAGSETAYAYDGNEGKTIQLNETTDAAKFIFPYENEQFDFIFATSLFTHLRGNEIENYIKETSRVIKHGGICVFTFFILEQVGVDAVFKFNHNYENGFSHNAKSPLDAIAFREKYLKDIMQTNNFKINRITYGGWRGGEYKGKNGFQDVIVSFKGHDMRLEDAAEERGALVT